jgi:uncharacterized protein (TIGR00369 family)
MKQQARVYPKHSPTIPVQHNQYSWVDKGAKFSQAVDRTLIQVRDMSSALHERINFGLNQLLGIDLVSATQEAVLGHLRTGPEHLTEGGRIHGGTLMAFADTLGAYGAILNLPDGATTATLESKSHFFRPARIGLLVGEAVPLHRGRRTMVWQTTISDEDNRQVALITQTQMVLEEDESAGNGAGPGIENPEIVPLKPSRAGDARSAGNRQRTSVAADRRAQILKAAFEVISRKGFGNASMREIARAAAMPIPTIYQYVQSKDEILASIFETYLSEIEAGVVASTEQPLHARQKLRAAVAANLQHFDRYQSEIRVMNRETRSLRSDVRVRVKENMLRYIGHFELIIKEGIACGEFRNCNPQLVANLVAMLCEIWPLRQWSIGHYGLETVRDCMLDLVLSGLMASPEESE